MEADGITGQQLKPESLDEDSGSLYEMPFSSDYDANSPVQENVSVSGSTKVRAQQERRRTIDRHFDQDGEQYHSSTSDLGPGRDAKIREDAVRWAASFQEPLEQDIKTPIRHSKKRKVVEIPASHVRARRVKGFYSNDYREMLNLDIHQVVERIIREDQTPLGRSQIGSSVWTSEEKDIFFSALSRLGRGEVQAIATCMRSKTELEVQQYIQLLHQELTDKTFSDLRQQLLGPTDMPAAIQISEDCCDALEKASDALASRQELSEEQAEKAKWGDHWRITFDVIRSVDDHRNDEGSEKLATQLLPAADLLNLKNWLLLSEKIFMNPSVPREEDNWKVIAEPGEEPGIRATAFEDYRSLAINITKRLVSTTLFCTMSRLRAMESKKIKYAEVNRGDVEAAVNILELKINSNDFWIGCARRCNLEVFNDDPRFESSDIDCMSYEEVEIALGQRTASRSRSQSMSRIENFSESTRRFEAVDEPSPSSPSISELESEDLESDEDSLSGGESEDVDSPTEEAGDLVDFSDTDFSHLDLRQAHVIKRIKAREAIERAQDKYTEEFDAEASRIEEERLWLLLRETPPLESKNEMMEMPEQPNKIIRGTADFDDWRRNLEYWSQWETLETPAPSESFARNRKLSSRRAKRLARVASSQRNRGGNIQPLTTRDEEGSSHPENGDARGWQSLEEQDVPGNENDEDERQLPLLRRRLSEREIVTHFHGLSESLRVSNDETSIKSEHHE